MPYMDRMGIQMLFFEDGVVWQEDIKKIKD